MPKEQRTFTEEFKNEEKQVTAPISLPTEFTCIENWKPTPSPCDERDRLKRHSQYQDRYAQVLALRELGLGNVEI